MRVLTRIREWLRRRGRETPLGERGEAAAGKYLRRLGYQIVGRQDRHRLGEIDIVAVDGQTVVFVEVKTRTSHAAGHPAEAITPDKQRRLTRVALSFLKRHGLLDSAARFDVIAVTWEDPKRRPTIEHYQNAFEAVGQGQMFS
jgi:putative endonuclease